MEVKLYLETNSNIKNEKGLESFIFSHLPMHTLQNTDLYILVLYHSNVL